MTAIVPMNGPGDQGLSRSEAHAQGEPVPTGLAVFVEPHRQALMAFYSSDAVFGCGRAASGENPLAFDVAEVVDSFVGGLPDQPKQCALFAR